MLNGSSDIGQFYSRVDNIAMQEIDGGSQRSRVELRVFQDGFSSWLLQIPSSLHSEGMAHLAAFAELPPALQEKTVQHLEEILRVPPNSRPPVRRHSSSRTLHRDNSGRTLHRDNSGRELRRDSGSGAVQQPGLKPQLEQWAGHLLRRHSLGGSAPPAGDGAGGAQATPPNTASGFRRRSAVGLSVDVEDWGDLGWRRGGEGGGVGDLSPVAAGTHGRPPTPALRGRC